eukprot:4071473-Pleurochrysis_carterae.AAC.1
MPLSVLTSGIASGADADAGEAAVYSGQWKRSTASIRSGDVQDIGLQADTERQAKGWTLAANAQRLPE